MRCTPMNGRGKSYALPDVYVLQGKCSKPISLNCRRREDPLRSAADHKDGKAFNSTQFRLHDAARPPSAADNC